MANKQKHCWNWRPNSKSEKILLAIAIIFILVTIFLVIGLIFVSKPKPKVCNSKPCVEAAYEMLANMDISVDPCTDFYQFACGGFANKTDFLDTLPMGQVEIRFRENIFQLRTIIDQPIQSSDPKYAKLVKELYLSCVNESTIEELGSSPLLAMLSKVGGWPVVQGSDWKENEFDWRQILIEFRRIGVEYNHFFSIDVIRDSTRHVPRNIISLSRPWNALNEKYHKEEKYQKEYLNGIINLAVLLGADKTRADREMKEVLDFEISLVGYEKLSEEEQKDELKVMKVYELQKYLPQISWVDFLNSLNFSTVITDYTEVIVSEPKMLKQILTFVSSKNKKIIANYLLAKVVMDQCLFLDKRFQIIFLEFFRGSLLHLFKLSNRKNYCSELLDKIMNEATIAMFIKNLFDSNSKIMATEISNNIKDELNRNMKRANWMDPETLESATEKLKRLELLVGYSGEKLDETIIDDYYASLTFSEDTYFNNVLQLRKFFSDDSFATLGKRIEDFSIRTSVATSWFVIYNYRLNNLEISADMLQRPFFNHQWPKYLNYGGIGSFVGNGLIQGFNYNGKNYDRYGNNFEWWSNNTEKHYLEKVKLLSQQLSKLSTYTDGMNPSLKNNAFNNVEGISLAYKAYQKWEKNNKVEIGLPGLSFNSRQLFWISAANSNCANVLHDYRTYNRVIASVINSESFSKDFTCPIGSPMNPKQKISFWGKNKHRKNK